MCLRRLWMTAANVAVLSTFLLSAATAAPPRDAARFVPLGSLPGGAYGVASQVWDMTPDGSVIVGRSPSESSRFRNEAFRWDWEGGMVGLGDFEGPDFASRASGVSDDGEIVVGGATNSWRRAGALFRWDPTSGMQDLGFPPSEDYNTAAFGVSGDGRTIFGQNGEYHFTEATGNSAYHWTEEEGMRPLFALPPGYTGSFPWDASYDGSVIVGLAYFKIGTALYNRAFRWEASTGMLSLGLLPDSFGSQAKAVSADGGVIVGSGYFDYAATEAFRWDEVDGMVALGTAGAWRSEALGVSSNGRFIVGTTGVDALIWDEDLGVRRVRDILEDDYGLDVGAWQLVEAVRVSDNGRVIAGNGRSVDDDKQGWVAVLPAPRIDAAIDIDPGKDPNPIRPFSRILIPVALLGSESLDVGDVDPDTLAFGPGGALPLSGKSGALVLRWDVNRDGFQDLTSFYWTDETGIALGDSEACLMADTWDESIVEGCDAVLTKLDCGGGFELALLVPLPVLLWRRRR